MPALKYLGVFEQGFRSGFITSPDKLQQGNSKLFGLVIDWDGPNKDLNLTYKVGFRSNTFLNGLLNPNTLIQSGGDDFITAVQVGVKREGGFWFFLPSPSLTVKVIDANGNALTASNNQAIRADNGITSLSIEFV